MIALTNVAKHYILDGHIRVPALVAVNLRISQGEIVSIVGSNGSGKTSLLKCIAGLLTPDTGEVALCGRKMQDIPSQERGRFCGMVYQNPAEGTAAHLTVEENIALGDLRGRLPNLRRLFRGDLRQRIGELLAKVGTDLVSRSRQRCGTLSGGQRQSVALLTAVVGQPKVLLLDEATASLDPNASKTVSALTLQLAQEYGLTVLAVTHSHKQAIDFGSRLLILNKGAIVCDVSGEAKRSLTPQDTVNLLEQSEDSSPRVVSSNPHESCP